MTNRHLNHSAIGLALGLAATVLIGCKGPVDDGNGKSAEAAATAAVVEVDQTSFCLAKETASVTQCRPGQKVVFLPSSWGNEQLPILFAALNCDLRYTVALTHGGVTCIYAALKPKPAAAEVSAPAEAASK